MSPELPKAAAALIISKNNRILAVSRKHDFEDLGLPGGKLDPNESFYQAVVRETLEETGLVVVKSVCIFENLVEGPQQYWCQTFLCQTTGTVHSKEVGRLVWVYPKRLIFKTKSEFNSFGYYNTQVLNALEQAKQFISISDYYSFVTEHKILNDFEDE